MPLTDEQWDYLYGDSGNSETASLGNREMVRIGRYYFTRDQIDTLMDCDLPGVALTITVPEPRYYVLADRNRTAVCERPAGRLVASFHHYVHPNPKAAAEAEAARLNREVER